MSTTSEAVESVFRDQYGRVTASLIGYFRDFDVAEEAIQDAFVTAIARWPRDGVPNNPAAWITQTAKRKAIDNLRREGVRTRKYASLAVHDQSGGPDASDFDMLGDEPASSLKDERLQLIFTCCHPALNVEAQVALTLRTLGVPPTLTGSSFGYSNSSRPVFRPWITKTGSGSARTGPK